MAIDRQTQALLALVEVDRAKKCDAILTEAQARAATLLDEAHANARRRMREMFREERERADERVAAAAANLQTRRRLALQRRAAALLAAGWQRLPAALVHRWQQPDARREWVAAVIASAIDVLPRTPWTITHAPDWPDAERDVLAGELEVALPVPPLFAADQKIVAGLRIAAGGNVIDGTAQGLLADRAAIGGELLRLLESTEPGSPP